MKVVVLNVNDHTKCTYEFVNDFLLRRGYEADYLQVYQLSFKEGKLEEGPSVGHFNKVKKLKLEEFQQYGP